MFVRINDVVINTDKVEVIEKEEAGLRFCFSGHEEVIPAEEPDVMLKRIMKTMNTGFASAIFKEV